MARKTAMQKAFARRVKAGKPMATKRKAKGYR